jgi:hypothetical protein
MRQGGSHIPAVIPVILNIVDPPVHVSFAEKDGVPIHSHEPDGKPRGIGRSTHEIPGIQAGDHFFVESLRFRFGLKSHLDKSHQDNFAGGGERWFRIGEQLYPKRIPVPYESPKIIPLQLGGTPDSELFHRIYLVVRQFIRASGPGSFQEQVEYLIHRSLGKYSRRQQEKSKEKDAEHGAPPLKSAFSRATKPSVAGCFDKLSNRHNPSPA